MARINWTVAIGLTLIGLVLGAVGVLLAGSNRDTWAAVLINAAVALSLAAFLTAAEGRLVREVSRTTSEAVRRETESLNQRLLHLEDLDDAQRVERERRDEARRAELADFERSDLSVERV